MSAVILQNEIVHYEVLGRGRPLIFLHSWVGSWRYWIPAMQAASASFRAYALDLWGFGDTAKATALYTIEQQASLLADFMDSLGMGRVALIGHGLGALVALEYTARQPAVVDRVMAIGLPCAENALHARLGSATPGELADWLLGHSPAPEPVRMEAPKADQKSIQVSLSGVPSGDLATRLTQLATPCLLVYGQNDPLVAAPPAEVIGNLPESANLITFDMSGHYAMLDEPNKFNRLMTDFLELKSGESPRQLQLKEEWKRRVR